MSNVASYGIVAQEQMQTDALTPAELAEQDKIPNADERVLTAGEIQVLTIQAITGQGKINVVGGEPVTEMSEDDLARMAGTFILPAEQVIELYHAQEQAELRELPALARSASRTSPVQYNLESPGTLQNWPVVDQGKCGSCWACAACDVYSYHVARSQNKVVVELVSIQQLLNCSLGQAYDGGGSTAKFGRLSQSRAFENGEPGRMYWVTQCARRGMDAMDVQKCEIKQWKPIFNGCAGGNPYDALRWFAFNGGFVWSTTPGFQYVSGVTQVVPAYATSASNSKDSPDEFYTCTREAFLRICRAHYRNRVCDSRIFTDAQRAEHGAMIQKCVEDQGIQITDPCPQSNLNKLAMTFTRDCEYCNPKVTTRLPFVPREVTAPDMSLETQRANTKEHIMQYGPTIAAVTVYNTTVDAYRQDFLKHNSANVFPSKTASYLNLGRHILSRPDHSIVITGWAAEPDTGREYWIIRNTWGRAWNTYGRMNIDMNFVDTTRACGLRVA